MAWLAAEETGAVLLSLEVAKAITFDHRVIAVAPDMAGPDPEAAAPAGPVAAWSA
jgi:hypothetical protein